MRPSPLADVTDVSRCGRFRCLDVLTAATARSAQARIAGALYAARAPCQATASCCACPARPTTSASCSRRPAPASCRCRSIPRLTAYERDAIIRDVEPALVIDDPDGARGRCCRRRAHGARRLAALPPDALHVRHDRRAQGRVVGTADTRSRRRARRRRSESCGASTPDDLDLVVSPIYHSAPLRFAMGTLLAGGSIAVLPEFDPRDFVETVTELRPTSMFCVPAHLQRLFAWLDEHDTTLDASSLPARRPRRCAVPRARTPARARDVRHRRGVGVLRLDRGPVHGLPGARMDRPPRHRGPGEAGPRRHADEDGQLWCAVPEWARFTYWNAPDKTRATWKETPMARLHRRRPRPGRGRLCLPRLPARGPDHHRRRQRLSGRGRGRPRGRRGARRPRGVRPRRPASGDSGCARRTSARSTRRRCARSRPSDSPRPSGPRRTRRLASLPRTATGKVRRTEL